MSDFPHRDFLQAWFPSVARSEGAAQFFWAHNEFLCTTPGGKLAVLDDKLLLSGALAVGGVRTPATLLAIIGGRFVSASRGEVSEDEAARLLEHRDAFIKARTGWGGEGSFRLDADGTIHAADGSRIGKGLPGLLRKIRRSDHVVQELVRQDERYAAVASASVNTVRCVTLRDRSGALRVAGAAWRMGNGKAVVDNASSGGLFCGIDPETGRILGPARNLEGESFGTHPASGFRFEGAEVPDVRAAFETAMAAHRLLDTSMSIGWDVAMTPEGPAVIEGNGHWMPELHTLADDRFEQRLWQAFMAGRNVAGSGFPGEERRFRRGDMIRVTLSIRGKVQGVGYRKWISRHAEERGVQARPENLEDGTVRCRLIGQRWRVEFVTLACHNGPAAAEVERVDVQEVKRLR